VAMKISVRVGNWFACKGLLAIRGEPVHGV
jgi:hypothetical protein